MTVKQKKLIIALRQYYNYLNARFNYIALGFIEIPKKELYRMYVSRNMYRQAFYDNIGLRDWLLKQPHDCRKKKDTTQRDKYFLAIVENLKNEILESEK